MDKEELIEFLKENLVISIDVDYTTYMSSNGLKISLSLGDELNFRLHFSDGQVHSGALGINVEPPSATEHALRVAGHASLIQGDEWLVVKYVQIDLLLKEFKYFAAP